MEIKGRVGGTKGKEDVGLVLQKLYKSLNAGNISNLWVASMNPGDRKVAGCFDFYEIYGGFCYGRCSCFC